MSNPSVQRTSLAPLRAARTAADLVRSSRRTDATTMKIGSALVGLALCAAATSSCAQQERDWTATNHDFFDLHCVPSRSGVPDVLLHVDVAANGQFDVTTRGSGNPVPHDTQTYTNAVTWVEGDEHYALDRSSSELSVRPSGLIYECEKIGGRRF